MLSDARSLVHKDKHSSSAFDQAHNDIQEFEKSTGRLIEAATFEKESSRVVDASLSITPVRCSKN
jgi:hypothetical protein